MTALFYFPPHFFTFHRTSLQYQAVVKTLPEMNDLFKKVVLPEMAQSMKVENGVLAMYAAANQDSPNTWVFFEIYESDVAYESTAKRHIFKII